MECINVIGGGLAGCEAAWQAANRGVRVRLCEMKPHKFSPAHKNPNFAELVCSNSLRAEGETNASGLLKRELVLMDSLIMEAAYKTRVPAGGALAVDREGFSAYITGRIRENKNIEIINAELGEIPADRITIIATGPLTSDKMRAEIQALLGEEYLFFFDAAAPVIARESIDFNRAFFAARYGKGGDDYINCALNEDEYYTFYNALIIAKTADIEEFDREYMESHVFEGCMPVEVMARRGIDTLRFGPLKPVGITDPATGYEPYANIQLRQDDAAGTMFNMVGFQTNLTYGEQKRVFSTIPALKNCEFLRYGKMHRNTFINSPKVLTNIYNLRNNPHIFFAGQITGVEGYLESVSSGLIAGINAALLANNRTSAIFPPETAMGALADYISQSERSNPFQPMNINYGIISSTGIKVKGGRAAKRKFIADRAAGIISNLKNNSL